MGEHGGLARVEPVWWRDFKVRKHGQGVAWLWTQGTRHLIVGREGDAKQVGYCRHDSLNVLAYKQTCMFG